MTREEKINLLNELLEYEEKNDIGNLTRAERGEFQQWVKGLEQEPILDKIRAEIEEIETHDDIYIDRAYVLEILDKYKAESEK